MNAKEVLKTLYRHGFSQVSQKGSHLKLSKDEKKVTVPVHGTKGIPISTLKSIEKQSGVKLR